MKLPQLQALASELGVSGTAKMRKSDLVDAIKNGGAPVAAPKQDQQPAQNQADDASERARRAAIAVTEAAQIDGVRVEAPRAEQAPSSDQVPQADQASGAGQAPRSERAPRNPQNQQSQRNNQAGNANSQGNNQSGNDDEDRNGRRRRGRGRGRGRTGRAGPEQRQRPHGCVR